MRLNLKWVGLGLVAMGFWGVMHSSIAAGGPSVKSSSSEIPGGPTGAPVPGPSPTACDCKCPGVDPKYITALEGAKLLQEFQKAQMTEVKAIEHRNRVELQEFRILQKGRLKDWEKEHTEERRKFFRDHSKGADKRQFVQDVMSKRDAFVQVQKTEYDVRTRELEGKVANLKKDQETKLKEFRDSIDKNERPSTKLWP